MKILITGSSGRVGKVLAHYFSRIAPTKHEVIGVDILPGAYTSIRENILSHDLVPLIKTADAIIHCAALHAPHVNSHSEQAFWDTNVSSTEQLLKHARDDASIVLTSTTSVYGHALEPSMKGSLKQRNNAIWVDENLTPKARDIYDTTKLAAEALVNALNCERRSSCVLRISRCFPEPEELMALYRLYRGVDLRDVAQAHALALERKTGNATYVISGPDVFQPSDIVKLARNAPELIASRAPALKAYFDENGFTLPQSIDRIYSSTLAMKELAYRPRFGMREFLSGDRKPEAL